MWIWISPCRRIFRGWPAKILNEAPPDYEILQPTRAVCAARAAARPERTIPEYAKYAED